MTCMTDCDPGRRAAPPGRLPGLNVRGTWLLAVLIALSASPAFANAAHILGVRVVRHGSRFSIDLHMSLRESPRAVFAALQDYRAMPRYNRDLRAVRVEPTARPDAVRLFTAVHACALIFCRTLHQTQIMTAAADAHGGTLRARLLPGGSFRSGHARWTVQPCAQARGLTCLDMHIELEPAFWVPPVIGPWILRRKMAQEARRSGIGLARVAMHLSAPPAHRAPVRPAAPGSSHRL
jgi:hypothetical protein